MNGNFNKTIILRPLSQEISNSPQEYYSNGGAILKLKSDLQFTANLSTINFNKPTNGKFVLIMATSSNDFEVFELDNPPIKQTLHPKNSNINSNDFIGAVILLHDRLITCVAYGFVNTQKLKPRDFLNYYEKNYKESKTAKNTNKGDKYLSPTNANGEKSSEIAHSNEGKSEKLTKKLPNLNINNELSFESENNRNIYNDEAVAECNYYELDSKNNNPLTENNYEPFCNQANDINQSKRTEIKKAQTFNDSPKNEDAQCNFPRDKEPKFYNSIKDKIESLFKKYPPISALMELLPESEWIKITYSDNKNYAIGKVLEKGTVRYIAYGIPGYKNAPPKGFERYSAFIPESIYLPNSSGYWCIFQCAVTGKEVHPPKE